MDQLKQKISELSQELEKIPMVKLVAQKAGVEAGLIAIGIMSFLFVMVFFGLGASLIVHVVGILYPAYMSFKAIESPAEDDDTLWLTYWVVFAVYNFADRFIDYLFFWVPCYFLVKLIVLVYMFFPQTRGAIRIYNVFFRPIFKIYEAQIDQALNFATEEARKKIN
ncbi:hypothetical protein SteCoe_11180 [Stentor coeruleus]|uniref:Receptor expression-enhancing protein n=1 Tax=Stentor coeruleus TaxID=5963 RepID=A0A1R2CDT1_9CILI|nr:hypothetical protein SteCoe_11180 [Stentor coeruleus]